MSVEDVLFSGQGKISLHTRLNGVAQAGLLIGNSPDLKIALTTETEDHIESKTGNRLTDGRLQKANKATVSFSLENFVEEVLALALYGLSTKTTPGTVTAETLPAGALVNQILLLQHQNVSSLVVKDSTPVTPLVLPVGQYDRNLKHGSIVLNDLTTSGPYVQPFKADYAYGASTQIAMFKQTIPERWLRFEGVNTAKNNEPCVVDLYRVALDPISDFGLIQNSFASFPMTGGALVDTSKQADGALGQFGRVVLIPLA